MPLGNSRGSLQDAPFVQKLAENISTTGYEPRKKNMPTPSVILEHDVVWLRTSLNKYVDLEVFDLVA